MNEFTKTEVREVAKFISNDMSKLGIETFSDKKDLSTGDELKKYIISKISYLIDHDYDRLINALYRIDLDEQKLHDLFSGKNRESIPERLADLILERQMQKLYWRKKYRDDQL